MLPNTNAVPHKVSFVRGGPVLQSNGNHQHNKQTHFHDHDTAHGHSHELMESAGLFAERERPLYRNDWKKRAFTVGIGGPVGSGKTALVLSLCRFLRNRVSLAVVTNDIFTREDAEFLIKNSALDEDRIAAVETGGCPHAAIREDISVNMDVRQFYTESIHFTYYQAVRRLTRLHRPELMFVESGGDNLAANFSRELADYIIYVIDVAGGDKIPRKGGPGITQSDLFVINKTDLADAVGASLDVMRSESQKIRQNGPTVFTQIKNDIGVEEIASFILENYKSQTGKVIL